VERLNPLLVIRVTVLRVYLVKFNLSKCFIVFACVGKKPTDVAPRLRGPESSPSPHIKVVSEHNLVSCDFSLLFKPPCPFSFNHKEPIQPKNSILAIKELSSTKQLHPFPIPCPNQKKIRFLTQGFPLDSTLNKLLSLGEVIQSASFSIITTPCQMR